MEQNFKGFFNCTSQEELFEFKEELLKNNEKECQELLARSQRLFLGNIFLITHGTWKEPTSLFSGK